MNSLELSSAQNRSCSTCSESGLRVEVVPGLLELLAAGIAAERGQVNLIDQVTLRASGSASAPAR